MGILKIESNEKKKTIKIKVEKDSKIYNLVIPSKFFPLSNQRTMGVFNSSNTENIEDENLMRIIDSVERKQGFCYSNSENLFIALTQNGYDPKYYSGWLFIGEVPVHHAWIVLNDKHIIDLSMGLKDMTIASKLNYQESNWREQFVDKLIELEKLSNSKRYIVGEVPLFFPMLYIGSESTPIESRALFNNAIGYKENPIHLLRGEGMNLYGASKTQEIYYNKKEFKNK